MTVKIQEKRQIAIAIEATEGTPETLDAGDVVLVLAKDTSYKPNPGMHDRGLLQASLSQHPELVGVEAAGIQTAIEMKGSGSVSTPPACDPWFKACGHARSALKKITIGAIATGPYVHGETITGGTSTATGRVIGRTANGVTTLEFVSLTGTFQSGEVITGGTSGASATSSSAASAAGYVYEPASSGVESATVAMYHDGLKKLVYGARGNLTFRAGNAKPGELVVELTGVDGGVSDVSLLTGITYEETLPPVIKGATAAFGDYSPVLASVETNSGNVVALRESMAAAKGAVSARITARRPSARFDPELDSVANFDAYGNLKNGATFYAELAWGSVAGNRFKVIWPELQITDVTEGDRSGVSVAQCTAKVSGGFDFQDAEVCYVFR